MDYHLISSEAIEWATNETFFGGNLPFADIHQGILSPDLMSWQTITFKGDECDKKFSDLELSVLTGNLSTTQSERLRLILDELVTNALKHSLVESEIVVSWMYGEGREVILRVQDKGGKLSKDDLQKLFADRDSVTPRSDSSGQGAGLGLYFCKEFSEQIFFSVQRNISTEVLVVIPYRSKDSAGSKIIVRYISA